MLNMKNLLFIITFFLFTGLNAQCVSGNCDNGYGVKKYKDGTMYVGEWWNGEASGQGTVIWPNGSIYVGEFIKGLYSGEGTLLTNNDFYVGEFDKNIPNGSGSMFMSDGSVYVGEFKEGEMSGKGFFQHRDGTIEESLWKDGKPVGSIFIKRENYILRKD